jgi:hypothetical protein
VTTALRPRTVTEIVDAAFQILRAHYGQFVVCSSIAYIPYLVVRLVVVGDVNRFIAAGTTTIDPTGFLWVTLWSSLMGWLTFTMMDSVLVACASQAYLGEEVDTGKAVRRALVCLPKVLLAGVLWFVFVSIGFLALLVGAVYVAARCFAVIPSIVLENKGVLGAFSRSSVLSKGRKRHILNTLGLVVLIYWIVVVGALAMSSLFGNFVLTTLVTSAVTVLVYPVVAITETLLYYDARIQSEGLDIELMADELGLARLPDPAPR